MRISKTVSENNVLKVILFVGWLTWTSFARGHAEPCPRCGWSPPQTATLLVVRNMNELREALSHAKPGTTILLEDGDYPLDGRQIAIDIPRIVVRGKRGSQARVLIRGQGMSELMVALSVNAPDITLADLTISNVGYHGIQIRGESGASNVKIHHVHILDTGEQLIKGSTARGKNPCVNGLVACSTLEYTDSAPSDYTNGIDVLNGENWVVRDNTIRRIRGPRARGFRAGPAILFWGGSRKTLVERNWLVDCYRGIALGLSRVQDKTPDGLDHQGGVILRNVVCNLNPWADEGIEVNASPGTTVIHNTVLIEGGVPWSIGIRFPTASAKVWNNLCNRQIVLREGAKADLKANLVNAQRHWFTNAEHADLRLARPDHPAIDAGVLIIDAMKSAVAQGSFSGRAPDAGAFEYRGPSR